MFLEKTNAGSKNSVFDERMKGYLEDFQNGVPLKEEEEKEDLEIRGCRK